MKYRRSATPVQRLMFGLWAGAMALLALFLIPEIVGVLSPDVEDTFTELVADLDGWRFWTIVVLSAVAGAIFTWSAFHFIEHRVQRRKEEKRRGPPRP